MRHLTLLCLILVLPSCGFLRNLQASAEQSRAILEQAGGVLTESTTMLTDAKAAYSSAKVEADTNDDGETDMMEWLAWLLGPTVLGGGGLLAHSAKRRREGEVRNAQSDGRKDLIEKRLEVLENPGGPT